jgi:hypothetical protein
MPFTPPHRALMQPRLKLMSRLPQPVKNSLREFFGTRLVFVGLRPLQPYKNSFVQVTKK